MQNKTNERQKNKKKSTKTAIQNYEESHKRRKRSTIDAKQLDHWCSYLSEVLFRVANDVQICRNDLRDVGDTLDAETLEDEGDGLDDHRVVLRQRRVADVAHEDRDRYRRVEVGQGNPSSC